MRYARISRMAWQSGSGSCYCGLSSCLLNSTSRQYDLECLLTHSVLNFYDNWHLSQTHFKVTVIIFGLYELLGYLRG